PHMPSARPYNVMVGQLLGVGAGFLALYLSNAWAGRQTCSQQASVSTAPVGHDHIGCAHDPCVPGSKGRTACRSGDYHTRLTGAMQTRRDAIAVIVSVLLVTAMGEPVRRLRLKRAAPNIADQ